MKKSVLNLFVLMSALSITTLGQDVMTEKQELGVSVSTIEMNNLTFARRFEPKLVYGVYFIRDLSKLKWISTFDFGKNTITDDHSGIVDGYYGIGLMTDLGFSSGLRFTFFRKKSIPVRPFIESAVYYSFICYRGSFDGGISGEGIDLNNIYNIFGISGRFGLNWNPAKRISFAVSSSFRVGYGMAEEKYTDYVGKLMDLTLTAVQIRIGYLF